MTLDTSITGLRDHFDALQNLLFDHFDDVMFPMVMAKSEEETAAPRNEAVAILLKLAAVLNDVGALPDAEKHVYGF